ncbi:MAG: hypothetical protein ACLFPE_02620 [Bacteroidales bacterium]
MKPRLNVLFCNCSANIFSGEKVDELKASLKLLDANVFELHDLCALAVHDKAPLESLLRSAGSDIFIACYPRAVKNILRQNGIANHKTEVINLREMSPPEIIRLLKDQYGISDGEAAYDVVKTTLEVPAWYPVVDHAYCNLCGKCSRFCMFGVYKFDKKSLEVVNPLACKNNCPACGRKCPASAIIFPRLPENSVLSGADPSLNDNQQVDEGELYSALNRRNRARKSIFREGVVAKARNDGDDAAGDNQTPTE